MIIVDNALRAREASGQPIRVGMIGAGFMAQGLANQIINSVPGMELAAVYGRQRDRAADVLPLCRDSKMCVEASAANAVRGRDPCRPPGRRPTTLFCSARSEQIDVACRRDRISRVRRTVVLEAFAHGKQVVLMNAELDATIGPILQVYAPEARRHLLAPARATSRAYR